MTLLFHIRFVMKNLQKLDLSFISFLGPNALCQLVAKLPNIKSINFQMTPVTDQVSFISCARINNFAPFRLIRSLLNLQIFFKHRKSL